MSSKHDVEFAVAIRVRDGDSKRDGAGSQLCRRLKCSIAVPQGNDCRTAEIDTGQVEDAIAVEVTDSGEGVCSGREDRRLECSVAVSQFHRDITGTCSVNRGHIQIAVAIEVSDQDSTSTSNRRAVIDRRLKRSIAIAEQN